MSYTTLSGQVHEPPPASPLTPFADIPVGAMFYNEFTAGSVYLKTPLRNARNCTLCGPVIATYRASADTTFYWFYP